MTEITAYIVDDEAEIRNSISQFLSIEDIKTEEFEDAAQLVYRLNRDSAAVIISDIRMPGMDGLELLSKVMGIDSAIPVILITGHGDVKMAVDAMQSGAYDFIEKPFDPEQLLAQVKRAQTARALTLSNRELRNALADPERLQNVFIGKHASTVALRENILDYAQSDDHVLIRGEIGSGRLLAARAIHATSGNAKQPYHVVNCAALDDDELMKTLFDGGVFSSASPLTLVLHDIGLTSQKVQTRLAEAIKNFENDDRPHVRVIAIETLPCENQLNADLFYQLSGKTLDIQPLRKRDGDILMIFNTHFARFCDDYGHEIPELDAESASILLSAEWPGNLRQLVKFSEAAAMKLGGEAKIVDIIRAEFEVQDELKSSKGSPLKAQVEAFEEMLIRNALKRHRGSIAGVLDELAIPRRTLNEKMARYNLIRADYT